MGGIGADMTFLKFAKSLPFRILLSRKEELVILKHEAISRSWGIVPLGLVLSHDGRLHAE